MLNLNYNINNSLSKQCIGVLKYNYSASIEATAGGGGGTSAVFSVAPGNGGGAGCGISQSINIVPNLIYQINVGGGGATAQKGQNTTLFGFDDNDTKPISILLESGNPADGATPAGSGFGGNSGTGSFITIFGTTNITAFTGSQSAARNLQGQPYVLGGGGAGRNANGVLPSGQFQCGNGGAGGGGGGGAPIQQVGVSAIAGLGGVPGGGNANGAGVNGGGGGGGSTPNGIGGAGGNGFVSISYLGKTKAFVTNATTVFDGTSTIHTFASGSGTFVYTFPFPYEELVTPYQQLLCPPSYTE